MKGRLSLGRTTSGEAFDMTPVIDVVFLLIIFFMLVCQFITAEQFRVRVPEEIASAVPPKSEDAVLTLTVFPDENGAPLYAIGSERLKIDNPQDIAVLFAAAIDAGFRDRPLSESRTVRLRCDRAVTFGQVKPVLQGIAQSVATDVDWAVRNE